MTLEPYRQLFICSQKAKDSLLINKSSTPLTALLPSLSNGRFFLSLVSFSAILAEILIVCLSNVHYRRATALSTFTISTWLSTAIIAIMIITLVLIACCGQPKLPMEPNTLAAALCFLAESSILERFEGMDLATLETKERNEMISGLGLKYALYKTEDGEGTTMIVVDVER